MMSHAQKSKLLAMIACKDKELEQCKDELERVRHELELSKYEAELSKLEITTLKQEVELVKLDNKNGKNRLHVANILALRKTRDLRKHLREERTTGNKGRLRRVTAKLMKTKTQEKKLRKQVSAKRAYAQGDCHTADMPTQKGKREGVRAFFLPKDSRLFVYVTVATKRRAARTQRKLKQEFPNLQELIEVEAHPNGGYNWGMLRDYLLSQGHLIPSFQIACNGERRRFYRLKDMTEQQFYHEVHAVNTSRRVNALFGLRMSRGQKKITDFFH